MHLAVSGDHFSKKVLIQVSKRYNGIYRAIEHVFRDEALKRAARGSMRTGAASAGRCGACRSSSRRTPASRGRSRPTAGRASRSRPRARSRRATRPWSRNCGPPAPSSSGTRTCPTSRTATPIAARSFGRTGNAYDVRFSPGGSSGGTVTAVAANMAVLGTGTDTGNSIRMPAATSALDRRLSDARAGEHRRHRAARLAARQHRSDRAHRDRRGDCPLGDGRGRIRWTPATQGAPARPRRALHAVPEGRMR